MNENRTFGSSGDSGLITNNILTNTTRSTSAGRIFQQAPLPWLPKPYLIARRPQIPPCSSAYGVVIVVRANLERLPLRRQRCWFQVRRLCPNLNRHVASHKCVFIFEGLRHVFVHASILYRRPTYRMSCLWDQQGWCYIPKTIVGRWNSFCRTISTPWWSGAKRCHSYQRHQMPRSSSLMKEMSPTPMS